MARTCTFLLIIFVIIVTVTLILAQPNSKGAKNRPSKPATLPPLPTKVSKVKLDITEGSGEDEIFESDIDHDEDEDEDDDDDLHGLSGAGPLLPTSSACYNAQMKARDSRVPDPYVPQCTKGGAFSAQQCHSAIHMCWCVYNTGREIPGSRRQDTVKIQCSTQHDPDTSKSVKSGGGSKSRPGGSGTKQDEDIILGNNKNKVPPTTANIDIAVANHDINDINTGSLERQATSSSVLSRPGLLAAVIGCAVIGLLVAVILVMFVVYRMRKKDEGSYALDEPKSSPTIGYTKSHDREFFA